MMRRPSVLLCAWTLTICTAANNGTTSGTHTTPRIHVCHKSRSLTWSREFSTKLTIPTKHGSFFFELTSGTDPAFTAVGLCQLTVPLVHRCKRTLGSWMTDNRESFALLADFLRRHASSPEAHLVIDVGGNHGFYTTFTAKLGFHVHYYEPQAELRARACLTMLTNKCSSRVSMFGAGVGPAGSEHGSAAIMGSDGVVRAGGRCRDASSERCMQVFALDALYARTDTPPTTHADQLSRGPIALLKLDSEGWEILVLQGARTLLEDERLEQNVTGTPRARVGSIFVEIVPGRWQERSGVDLVAGIAVLARLSRAGYTAHVLTLANGVCPHTLVASPECAQGEPSCTRVVLPSQLGPLIQRMVEYDRRFMKAGQRTRCNFFFAHSSWI